MNLTWAQLGKIIREMSKEQKRTTVTVLDEFDEFQPVSHLSTDDTEGVLDENHPYLVIAR